MKKTLFSLLFPICILFQLHAQGQTSAITGTVFDDVTKEVIESASIRILNVKDSSYVTGTVTDKNGKFSVGVRPNNYIIQVSFLGYINHTVNVNARQNVSIGTIYLKENSVLLNEAVVEAKAVEMQVKGDTIEYNADSYKVQESAVVEDLLKKMPGVEVSTDGKITVNGKEVKKVLVDGKEFFSDDPKVASKNLPASMVDKLQVLDRKSDMSQMTGFDDGNEETVINLTVKRGMKQGVFGSAYAGYGTRNRYETNGMVNYMRNNTQISFLGGSNNTNNAGFSDFASSMFSGNRPRGINFGGNNGITKSTNGGFNFATEYSDKLKWGGNVRYGFIDNDVRSVTTVSFTGRDRTEERNVNSNNKSNNFGADLRFEWTPDSLTKIIFTPNVQYNKNDIVSSSENNIKEENLNSFNTTNSGSDGHGTKVVGNLDFSRKLNKKGRVFSFSIGGGLNDAKSDQFNNGMFVYEDPLKPDSIFDQISFQDDKGYNWKAFVSYVEPIGRSNFVQLVYNFRNNHTETDRIAYRKSDPTSDVHNIIDTAFTRNVNNDFVNQNVTLNFKSIRPKFNYTLGMGLEPSSSKTAIRKLDIEESITPRKHFLSVVPTGQFNYLWDRRHNLRIDYVGVTNQATALQLFDGEIKGDDGITTTRGNPNLHPSFDNRLNIRYQKFNPEKASAMMIFGRFTHTLNDIVTTTYWTGAFNQLTYVNINGNMSGNLRFIYNAPLRNKKFSFNTMTFGGYTRSNTYINQIRNTANIYSAQENLGLQFRSDRFDFNVRGNIAYNGVRNSIKVDTDDRDLFDYSGFGSLTWYLPHNFTFDTDLQYSSNAGYREGFKLEEWLWNASIAKLVFKNKAGMVRLKVYDILHQRQNISQNFSAREVQYISTNVLPSYVILHFTYKFQLFKGGAKRSEMENNMMPGGRMFRGGGPGGPPVRF